MQAGKFAGRFLDYGLGKNENTGNRYAQIAFQVVGGRFDGEVIRATKALTEKTAAQLREIFEACGWDGRGRTPDRAKLTRLVTLDVQVTTFQVEKNGVKEDRRGFEVAFVRPIVKLQNGLGIIEAINFFDDVLTFTGGAPPTAQTETGTEYDPETGEVFGADAGEQGFEEEASPS